MLRTNLSTRPFYNERAVRVWTSGLFAVAVAATILNVSAVLRYSRSDTELARQASQDESRTAELRRTAVQLRSSVDASQVAAASAEARIANDLIDRRTFSWTALFNTFEATLPPEVRITSVRPSIDEDRRVVVAIGVVARGVDDVDEFLEQLEATGGFRNLLSREEFVNDEGQLVAAIETVYVPPSTGSGQARSIGSGQAPSTGRTSAASVEAGAKP